MDELYQSVAEFFLMYGLQILGGLLVLIIGVKMAAVLGARVAALGETRSVDPTVSRFLGNLVQLVIIAMTAIFTLASFGLTVAPLVALVGAGAFGLTLAVQGPLSNYAAGLVLILTRPFMVGDTVRIRTHFGVVDLLGMGATELIGEDGERITLPNRKVLGEILVNSNELRMSETLLYLRHDQDAHHAAEVVQRAVGPLTPDPERARVGISGFFYGGVVLSVRAAVTSRKYFDTRFAINGAALAALRAEGIELAAPPQQSYLSAAMQQPLADAPRADEDPT